MLLRTFLLWLPMIVIAFANAAFRETVITKKLSELRTQQLSTLTLTLLISLYVWFIYPFLKINAATDAFWIGMIWVILTVIFEFSLGRILKQSWTNLFNQYDILSGNIWLVFILCLFFLPYWVYLIKP